jgi:nicotinamide-nucleotide adenylyltransferase
MVSALFVGRFQPFHLGHKKAIKYILKKEDRLILGIGSCEASNTLENPFTASERRRMIESSLGVFKDRVSVILVPDINDDSRWVSHVVSLAPQFDVVYTSSEREKRLFLRAGFKVRDIPLFKRNVYSATNVRERMIEGDDWRKRLPIESVRVVEEVGGVERIRKLTRA